MNVFPKCADSFNCVSIGFGNILKQPSLERLGVPVAAEALIEAPSKSRSIATPTLVFL